MGCGERLRILQHVGYIPITRNLRDPGELLRLAEVILLDVPKVGQNVAHGIGSHQREPSISAIMAVIIRECAEEESAEGAAIARSSWITLTICETPCSHVEWCVICSEESIASGEGDSIAENSPTNGICYDGPLMSGTSK